MINLRYLASSIGDDRLRFAVEYCVAGSNSRILLLDFLPTLTFAQHLAFQAEIGNAAVLDSMWRSFKDVVQKE